MINTVKIQTIAITHFGIVVGKNDIMPLPFCVDPTDFGEGQYHISRQKSSRAQYNSLVYQFVDATSMDKKSIKSLTKDQRQSLRDDKQWQSVKLNEYNDLVKRHGIFYENETNLEDFMSSIDVGPLRMLQRTLKNV